MKTELAAQTNSPPDASVFNYPGGLSAVMLACAIGFVGAALCAFYAALFHSSEPVSLAMGLCGVAFLGFFGLSLRASRRLRGRVAVNGEGIWYTSWRREETFIAWDQISRLETQETGQRLGLVDTGHSKTIWVEYQLQNFSKFRDFVVAHVPARVRTARGDLREFHRSWINKIGLSIIALACLTGAKLANDNLSASGTQGLVIMCLSFLVLCLISIAMDPLRVLRPK